MKENAQQFPSQARISQPQPDLVVGIDFGTTCTGCAYLDLSSGSKTVRYIQKWPGRLHVNENKVSTLLAYTTFDTEPVSWGFLGEKSGQDRNHELLYAETFKVLLDPAELRLHQQKDPANAPESIRIVEKWYEDFLRALYNHIESNLSKTLTIESWEIAHIHFIFSLPTTWTDKRTVEKFRSIIRKAGYGVQPSHSVDIGLTEAEAAAVHISVEQSGLFKKEDIILVCDAGGGTTDLSVLKVVGTKDGILSLRQLDVVSGVSVGSVAIDEGFVGLVYSILKQASSDEDLTLQDDDLDEMAWAMSQCADYQNTKCAFGDQSTRYFKTFSCPAPRFPPGYTNTKFGIMNQTLTIDRCQLQAIFDMQLAKLFDHINAQFESIEKKYPDAEINYLILTGGFGNSPYMQDQLKTRYEKGGKLQHPCTRSMLVKGGLDPQLAVCKGLVEEYVQKLRSGVSTIATRVCRDSYGILCSIPRTKENEGLFASCKAELDPTDQKWYYRDMVRWLIKRGEPISGDKPIEHGLWRILKPGDPNRTFVSKIVTSDTDADNLQPWRTADVRELCEISSTLVDVSQKEFEERHKPKLGFGGSKHHFIVRFQVKVIIGPGDLRFQLWFKGRKISADSAIKVAWMSVAGDVPSRPTSSDGLLGNQVTTYL